MSTSGLVWQIDKIRSEFIGIEDLAVEEDASTGGRDVRTKKSTLFVSSSSCRSWAVSLNPFYSPVG